MAIGKGVRTQLAARAGALRSRVARPCITFGNCFECDNCYGVCPDNAVIKLGPGKGLEFNYDYCKGCGVCATECPCGAIRMVPEETRGKSPGAVALRDHWQA